MKELLIKYKTVVKFVLLFLGTYFVLSLLYGFYLNASNTSVYYPDYITNLVARQSATVLEAFGYNSILSIDRAGEGVLLHIENEYTVSIVEGCNAISIIILFTAFIIAFSEKFKKTLLFILAGSAIIYTVNILRIAILVAALYKFPQYEKLLHSVVFPGIIYSIVLILWMVWVRMLKYVSYK